MPTVAKRTIARPLAVSSVVFAVLMAGGMSLAANRFKLTAPKPVETRMTELEAKVQLLESQLDTIRAVVDKLTNPGPQLIAR